MATVQLNAASVGGLIQTLYSGNIQVPASGLITVDVRDAPTLLSIGCSYVNAVTRWQGVTACRLGSAGRIVASTALANGTLSIANQPDVGRQLGLRIDPGAGTITAGVGTIIYTANDGVAYTDAMSLSGSAAFTTNTTKGVLHVTSVIVTALAGGSSPKVQLDDTNSLAMAVDVGYTGFAVVKANVDGADEAIGTVATAAASITPTTAPNATHTFGFAYTYTMPNT